jgi:HK97 family phage major capsid protein
MIDVKALSALVQEANELTNLPTLSKQQERRFAFLQTGIAAIKAGATLEQIQEIELNEVEARNGFRRTTLADSTPRETRAKAAFMRKLFSMEDRHDTRELRATSETEGALISQLGTYTGLGNFVPTDFSSRVFAAMKQYDFLYDPDKCTVINSTNANPYPIPVEDDTLTNAVQASEAQTLAQGAQTNLGNPGHVLLGAYSFRTPIQYYSAEVYTDAGDQASAGAYELFAQMTAGRLARGIGAKLINGTGPAGTTITGIIPALQAAGVNGVVAAGSGSNTGNADSAVTTVGSVDIANLFFSVNAAYRQSPKCAFAMNDATLQYLCKIVDKQGHPIVNLSTGFPLLMGKPVYVSPSIPTMSSSAISILFGAFDYWCTRLVSDDSTRIQVYRETRVEQGLVGLQAFVRADGILSWNSSNAASAPISYLIQHS